MTYIINDVTLCFLFLLQPGRVATLIEDHEAVTYGVAFQLINEAALDYLNNREVALGVSHAYKMLPSSFAASPAVFFVLFGGLEIFPKVEVV